MDEDQLQYAIPTLGMPPENRISCALESVVILRQVVGIAMKLLDTKQLKFTPSELRNAVPVIVRRDKLGEVTAEVQS